MLLLTSQVNQIFKEIDASRFERSDLTIDQTGQSPIIRFLKMPSTLWFAIEGSEGRYSVTMRPGEKSPEDKVLVSKWSAVLRRLGIWLDCVDSLPG